MIILDKSRKRLGKREWVRVGQKQAGLKGWHIYKQWPWEAPFWPMVGSFTGSSSLALKRTPHESPLPCQSTFLFHESPTAVTGWRWVLFGFIYSPLPEELGFVRAVVVACSLFGLKYVACQLFDGLAVDKCWLNSFGCSEKKKKGPPIRLNTWIHFSNVTYFFSSAVSTLHEWFPLTII